MLLTITTTHEPATDLGYLLHKNPARTQSFELAFGQAHVFYPEASAERCTAALLLDVDPVGLVRGGAAGRSAEQYVNDRPYVASSFLSVAIAQVLGSALSGRSRDRPELAETPIPLEARLSVVPCRGGEELLRRLWEPLGYEVETERQLLDPTFPQWGESRYHALTLRATVRLAELLRHLYVLIPVLDDQKHYWVGEDEVEKLLRQGDGWLAAHPERDLIARRYLRHRKSLTREALARLVVEEPDAEEDTKAGDAQEQVAEERIGLNEQRLGEVTAALRASGARRVADLGCGEGKLLRILLKDGQFDEILGMDVAIRSLEIAGWEAAAVVEVVEHLDPPRLRAFERVLWEFARPATVVLTTPNREYNQLWPTLSGGAFRHRDHRFEWTRAEFAAWAAGIGERFGYTVRILPVGPEDAVHGAPTQMGIFERRRTG